MKDTIAAERPVVPNQLFKYIGTAAANKLVIPQEINEHITATATSL